jgi:hypothetical protein
MNGLITVPTRTSQQNPSATTIGDEVARTVYVGNVNSQVYIITTMKSNRYNEIDHDN